MPEQERNSWDHANNQGRNMTDFNRSKSDEDYDDARQEAARTEFPIDRNDDDDDVEDISPIATNHNQLANDESLDFLSYGTSDDDIQI